MHHFDCLFFAAKDAKNLPYLFTDPVILVRKVYVKPLLISPQQVFVEGSDCSHLLVSHRETVEDCGRGANETAQDHPLRDRPVAI